MEWIERYTLDILRCEFEIGNLIRPVNTPSISNLWNHEISQPSQFSRALCPKRNSRHSACENFWSRWCCMPLLLRHTVWKTGAIVVGILYCTSGEARRLAHNAVLCCREPLRNNAARTNTNVHALG